MSFGGFGTGSGTGGFGAKPPSATGFGATPSMGTGTGAPATASGGRGFGGFGTSVPATSTTTTSGFGAAATTGLGAKPGIAVAPNAGGFGVGGGFGAGATSGGTGGFVSTATSGFGVGRGCGFDMAGGFGSMAPPAAPAAPTAQQYPYPGIKGPGYATSWGRDIDFSQVTEQVRFEALPQLLQQHLIELRSFMHEERDAAKKVYLYFNQSDGANSAAGAAATSTTGSSSATASSSSYRQLLTQMAALKGGGNRAVELVAVHCNQHEEQARRQLQRLEKLESNIRDYERQVWEPLLERGLPSSLTGSGMSARGCVYRPAVSNGAASPFVALVEELSRRMDHISSALAELEVTLLPPGRRLRGVGVSGCHGHHSSNSIPNDTIAQINAALVYELNQLRDSSCVAAHLHSRTNIARDLFTRQYGQAEADVLFADTEQQRNGTALFRRALPSTYFDIPSLPQQPQPPTVASVANTAMGVAAPTSGFGAGATSALGGGFGATSSGVAFGAALTAGTAGAATTGGFGPSATAAAAPAGGGAGGGFGFGATAPAAASVTGFGAATAVGSATATGAFGTAPATGGFGAASAAAGAPPTAPFMGPAAPGAPPTAFNLGGGVAATGAGVGMAPGKSGAGGSDDRPSRRTR